MTMPETIQPTDFIREIVTEDLKTGKNQGHVHTRFPPEPNGYLHIGHAKAITINFTIAQDFAGKCNLRFDDTNPVKEDIEYVESIREDIRWLGFDWEDREFYASDYFEKFYNYAIDLINQGKAYVDDLSAEEIRQYRGTLTEPGKDSPYRNRTVEENLDLFTRMKNGEFPDGTRVLRAKIDMSSPNIVMRDPTIFRIKHAEHHRTGDKWCIYPMYDFAHCISDALEGITHSLCSLEFEIHRPLYDWYLDQLEVPCHPRQIEFARLNLTYTVMSKRKLLELVQQGIVKSWNDPRMPTLSGMRRRGYTPEAIRNFARAIGVAKADSMVDFSLLEYYIREDLNKRAPRVMAVLNPVKVIIDNYPERKVEMLEAVNNPEAPDSGTREIPFSREIYIELDDFMEDPPKKFFRLAPGKEVRLKHAYYITCTNVVKDNEGNITELHCAYDPESRGGDTPDKRKVQGTLHWVSAPHAVEAQVNLYDQLFTVPNPLGEEGDYKDYINPDSLKVLTRCKLEPSLKEAAPGNFYQFLRNGYFSVDPVESTPNSPVFNRTATLKDTWAKIAKKS